MAISNSVTLLIIFQILRKTQISGYSHSLQLFSYVQQCEKNSLWKMIEFQNSIED